MANTYIKRTCDGGYTSTFTWSAWVKRSAPGNSGGLFCNKKNDSNSNSRVRFYFSSADRLAMEVKDSTGGDDSFFQTNKLFRDVNAWYNIVLAYDTTQSAENDRIKLWINNEEVTSWEQFDRASSGFGTLWSSAMEHRIGTQNSNAGTNYYFNGYMSHIHFTYGTAYTPSAFGETDATTGEWKIKTDVSVTYGSQGYFVLKDGNGITDQSGEGNNFTLGGGTLTDLKDNPDNVFATFNPLSKNDAGTVTFSNGNLKVAHSGTDSAYNSYSTIGLTSGKWYSEFKYEATSGGSDMMVGMSYDPENKNRTGTIAGADTTGFGYWSSNGDIYTNGNHSSFGNSYVVGDIVGMATDLDNNKVYFSKNGVWQNSGVPTSGSTGTGSAINLTANQTYFLIVTHATTTSRTTTYSANFGNGYFGTTAVSSAGTNASNNGIFEYDVPTGYTALSTKGLNL